MEIEKMRKLLIASTGALTLALVFYSGARAQSTQPSSAAAPIDPHDLSGVWLRVSPFQTFSNVDNRQPGLGGRRGLVYQEAPLNSAGKAAYEKSKPGYGPRAVPPAVGNDPMGTCDPLGIPRLLNAEYASGRHWEIVQTKDRMFQFFLPRHGWREIWTDGRALPKTDDLEPKWDGYSIGHWDGNTFVVDSIGFDDRTWLDKFGFRHTDQMKLQERYRRLDRDTLELHDDLDRSRVLHQTLGERHQDLQDRRSLHQPSRYLHCGCGRYHRVPTRRVETKELGRTKLLRALGRVQV